MKEIKTNEYRYEARRLHTLSDPVNSSWEAVMDMDSPEPEQVTGYSYADCLEQAFGVTEGDMEGVVVARVEVVYLIPSKEELDVADIATRVE